MDPLTRRGLRHTLMRRRNERVAELRDESLPTQLIMHPDTHHELLIDGDPSEADVFDFGGSTFLGIPVLTDPRMRFGDVKVDWPDPVEVPRG